MCVWYKESKCVKIENKYTLKWKLYVWGVGQSPLGPSPRSNWATGNNLGLAYVLKGMLKRL